MFGMCKGLQLHLLAPRHIESATRIPKTREVAQRPSALLSRPHSDHIVPRLLAVIQMAPSVARPLQDLLGRALDFHGRELLP